MAPALLFRRICCARKFDFHFQYVSDSEIRKSALQNGRIHPLKTKPLTPSFSSIRIMKEEPITVEGRIHTVLPGTMFRVELSNQHLVLATICGKMRKRWVRLTAGDRVRLEMSPYDMNKARIVWRIG